MPAPDFAHNLRQARRNAGLTQTTLAKAARISQQSLSYFEAGDRLPRFETLLRLAQALKTTPCALDAPRTAELHIPPELIPLLNKWPQLTKRQRNAILATINAMS